MRWILSVLLLALASSAFAVQPNLQLPFAEGTVHKCTQGANGEYSHQYTSTRYDIDLDTINNGDETLYAPVSGTVYLHDEGESGFGKHVNIDVGDNTFVLLGHCKSFLVSDGQQITTGMPVALEGCTGNCYGDHVHFGLHTGNPQIGASSSTSIVAEHIWARDVTAGGEFRFFRSDEFIGDLTSGHNYETGYLGTPYLCSPAGQDPPAAPPFWTKPGDIKSYLARFRNTGTATWIDSGGVGTNNYVELRSVFQNGTPKNCWLEPVDWIGCPASCNTQRVTSFDEGTVAPGQTATFTFQARTPNVPTDLDGEVVYFRPFHGADIGIDGWGEMNFLIYVDADAPQVPPNLSVNPSDCTSTNSFFFDWDASSDVGSGLDLYEWQINGSTPNSTTSTSVQVNGSQSVHPGTNVFYVRALDKVGNVSGMATVEFCFETDCNLSFNRDDDGNSVPDGWTADPHGGSSSSWPPGGIGSNSHYVRIVNADGDDWMIYTRTNCDQITPGQLYRIGFWYNTTSTAPFEWALFKSSVSTGQRSLNALVSNPTADGQWHQFQSEPFTINSGDLSTYPKFGVKVPPGSVGTFNFDEVFFVETELCQ